VPTVSKPVQLELDYAGGQAVPSKQMLLVTDALFIAVVWEEAHVAGLQAQWHILVQTLVVPCTVSIHLLRVRASWVAACRR
jgi:hypothetical protein